MKKLFLIFLFAVSFLNSANLAKGDSNTTIVQTVIEEVAEKSSIANNATINIVLYNSVEFLKNHIYVLFVVIIILSVILFYANKWIRILTILILIHVLYQYYSGISMQFPIIDILYSGFAFWSVSLLVRSFHKYFEKFENKNLATKINLLLHIFDILILLITIAFIVKSFNIKNIEIVTTGLGVAIFFIIRKDLNNLKSFLIISWDDFLSIGDKVVIGDKEGKILFINKFTTILQSDNGNIVKVPNSELIENPVVNKSKNKNHMKERETNAWRKKR